MFKELLEDFKKIQSTHLAKDETIFEICGFPHREIVISNVLAFFFDDENPHNLNGLLTESLFIAAGFPHNNLDLQFQVEREIRTKNGGYIDILLTNDSCCIVLENKILSPLNNDLQDYINYAKKTYQVITYGIVLSIREIEPINPNFVFLTYSKYFEIVKSKLGHYLGTTNNQYLFLLIDLINNIERIHQGGVSMNSEFLKFVRNNKEEVYKFGAELKTFHHDLRNIVRQVNSNVLELIRDNSVKQWLTRSLPHLYDIAVSDFIISNGIGLAIDSKIDPENWEYEIFVRSNPGNSFSLEDFCSSKGLIGIIIDERFILKEKTPLETDPGEVAQKLVKLIKTLQS